MEKIQRIKAIIDRTLPEHIAHCVSENSMKISEYAVPYWRIKLMVDAATLEHALALTGGNITLAASVLGISRNTGNNWVRDAEIDTESYFLDGQHAAARRLEEMFVIYEDFHREARASFYKKFLGSAA